MDDRTIGTSYYYSSLNYLGYSPYADPGYGDIYETKPFIYPGMVSFVTSAFFLFQQTYSLDPLRIYKTLRHCLEQEVQLVQQEVNIFGRRIRKRSRSGDRSPRGFLC
jgi:hypothetical protein